MADPGFSRRWTPTPEVGVPTYHKKMSQRVECIHGAMSIALQLVLVVISSARRTRASLITSLLFVQFILSVTLYHQSPAVFVNNYFYFLNFSSHKIQHHYNVKMLLEWMKTNCFYFLVVFLFFSFFQFLLPHNCQCASKLNSLSTYICTWESNWVIRSLDQSAAGDSPSPWWHHIVSHWNRYEVLELIR